VGGRKQGREWGDGETHNKVGQRQLLYASLNFELLGDSTFSAPVVLDFNMKCHASEWKAANWHSRLISANTDTSSCLNDTGPKVPTGAQSCFRMESLVQGLRRELCPFPMASGDPRTLFLSVNLSKDSHLALARKYFAYFECPSK
jgi:hypothetical protein